MRWKVIARRLLGRKGTRLLRNILSSLYHLLDLVPPPSRYRPYGVSAVMWTKNEEYWVAVAMKSVSEIVDEYVLIDASTDRTPNIAKEVGKELGIPVKIVKANTKNMAEVGNLGLKHSSYRWILKWDADFILHEDYVPFIKNLIEELDEKR